MFNSVQFNQVEFNDIISLILNIVGAQTIPIILDVMEETGYLDLSDAQDMVIL